MFNKFLFVLFSLSITISQAQQLAIELKNYPVEIKNRNFYISKVIDSRNDTNLIGWSLLNKETKGKSYILKNGLTNSFENYFEYNLKQETSQTPLILNVITLFISENTKGMKEGKARIVVQFLKEENGNFGKVFETSSYTESNSEIGKDIYTSHERRIRAVVNQCLKNLSESKWAEIKPDFISRTELQFESNKIDTLSKVLYDTAGLFSANRKEEIIILKQNQITMKSGIVPTFRQDNTKHHTLWGFKNHFKQLNDLETSKLYSDYKAKFKLTFFALGIGALFIGASFSDDSMEETGLPNLGLAVPGIAFAACSIPIYIKTNRLARKTINRYNTTIENK
jgi:hypothetical protein